MTVEQQPGPSPAPASRVRIRALPEAEAAAAPAPPAREMLLGIRPDELRRTGLLTAYLFVASSTFVLGRTIRDALFLSHFGARVGALLPFMFIAYGAASSLVAVVYARFAARVRRDHFVVAFSALAAAGYLAVRLALPSDPSWLYPVLYVGAEVVGSLTITQFWSVANDLHDARSAKRLFRVIGLGRITGLVVCGLGAGSVVREVGTENLLFVQVALFAMIAWFVRRLTRDYGLGSAPRTERAAARVAGSIVAPLRSGYVRALALMMLLGFVVVNVGDFQFKAAARLVHPTRDGLAHFMALFYAVMGAVALVLQLAVSPWVFRRFGVAGGVLALPIAYGVANTALALVPGLEAATLLKISDNAFQYTLFEAALQLLYFPLPPETKEGVRSFLEAIAKPLGYGLAGALVLALRLWWRPDTMGAIAAQSWVVLPLSVVWIAMIPAVRARYLRTLERSLSRREADPSESVPNDASSRAVLLRTLRAGAPRAAVYALEQLMAIDPGAAREVLHEVLGEGTAPALRAAGLRAAQTLGARELLPQVSRAIHAEDDGVAAAAAEALGDLTGEDCAPTLFAHLHSPRPRVQDAVLATLLRRGGLEGVLAAGRVVEAWLGSSDPADRARAAALFARPGIHGLQRIVRRLLEDPEPSVRRAAIAAAGTVGDASSCELLLRALADASAEGAAVRALAKIGDAALPTIDRALGDAHAPRGARLALPRVLFQMRTQAAYRVLLGHLDVPDEWVRQKVLASASRARAAGGYEPLAHDEARPRMLREIESVARLRAQYETARAFLAIPLLDRWILERLRKGLVRVLRLGELAHPRAEVAAAREGLFVADPARRARAVEILENLFDLPVRTRFVHELDALGELRASPLPRSAPARGNEDAFVRQLAALSDPFARVMALDAAQFRGVRLPDHAVLELTRDEDPAVREMAALVVATFRPEGWRDVLNGMRADEDLRVRTYAEYAFATGRTGMDPTDEMYTTLEKVLFLQRIALFADVPPEHLVSLARSAEVERAPAGKVVFRQGDPGDALYFVIDGKVRVLRPGSPPTDLGEGEVFGEMSVLDSAPRTAEARATEDSTLLRIAQEDFYDVLHDTAELAEGVIHVLVRRLRAASLSG